ncbi:MAG: YIEGIA domain-containing protein [Peptostreptococcaceae bacterium]
MEESLLDGELFRRSFMVALAIGTLCRVFVLRVTDKQYPARPQDYLEQLITAGLSASLGAIVMPALIDKEFAALTFFAVGIQQFQGLASQERITLENLDNDEIVAKGGAYVEEISSTYETRSYISLFSALVASIIYIFSARLYGFGPLLCTIGAIIGGIVVGIIFRFILRRDSIGDVADVVPAKIHFDESVLMVNDVVIVNIGLKNTKDKYLKNGIALEIKPKNIADFGIINDTGQRQAILHNMFIHLGINKDVDEVDILAISRTDLDKRTVLIPYIPILKDIDAAIEVIKSTPIIETAKGKQSAYKRKASFFK